MKTGMFFLALCMTSSAIANKGAALTPPPPPAKDNLDWSQGWYLGAGINSNAEWTSDMTGIPAMFDRVLAPLSVDEVNMAPSDIGFEIYLGRKINDRWQTEVGYTFVGKTRFNADELDARVLDMAVKQWNLHLVGIGKFPLAKNLNGFVKGGAAYFYSIQTFKNADKTVNTSDDTKTGALTYGLGLEMDMNVWGLRGEYNVIWPANNVRDDFFVSDIISGTLYYKFHD